MALQSQSRLTDTLIIVLLLLATVGVVALGYLGSVRVDRTARELVQDRLVLSAEQMSDQLSVRLRELSRRLSDPFLIRASRIARAQSEADATRSLALLGRSSDVREGVSLMLTSPAGEVLATDPRLPEEAELALKEHSHRHHQGDEFGVGLCLVCYEKMGTLSISAPLDDGNLLIANVDLGKLVQEIFRGSLQSSEISAALVNSNGDVLIGELTASTEGDVSATSLVDGTSWSVKLMVRQEAMAGDLRLLAIRLVLIAMAVVIFLIAAAFMIHRRTQKHAEERLDELDALAHQKRLAMMGLVAASVGHEMKNALTIAYAMVDLAADGANGQIADDLEEARGALDRLNTLSTDISGFARKDDVEMVDVESATREALRMVEPSLKSGPKTEVRVEASGEVEVPPNSVVQVLVNLLLNSAHELRDQQNGVVRVTVTETNDHVEWTVSDNGPGIPDGMHEAIFEAFESSKGSEGTGIGLWLSRQIARRYGGELRAIPVESGACFEFTLPRR